jgi:hypothetical protein
MAWDARVGCRAARGHLTETKLYVILGSHACCTGTLLLEHKGIDYARSRVTSTRSSRTRRCSRPIQRAARRSLSDRPLTALLDRVLPEPQSTVN